MPCLCWPWPTMTSRRPVSWRGRLRIFPTPFSGSTSNKLVEKAFKAWLSALGVEYPKTHDLHRLLVLLEENGVPMERFQWVEEFNPFAVQFRYETSPWDAPLDRGQSVAWTSELLDHVVKQIELLAIQGTEP